MAARTCIVTVTDLRGVRRSVDVNAESVFEAAARALSALRRDAWIDGIGPATRPGDSSAATRDHAHRHRAAVAAMGERIGGQPGRANQEGSAEDNTHRNRRRVRNCNQVGGAGRKGGGTESPLNTPAKTGTGASAVRPDRQDPGEEREGRGFRDWSRVRTEVVDVQQKGRRTSEVAVKDSAC